MGRIITNGRTSLIVRHEKRSADADNARTKLLAKKEYRIGHHGPTLSLYSAAISKVEVNIDLIREHFGVNNSDALRISLQLTANAIRANKARVEV